METVRTTTGPAASVFGKKRKHGGNITYTLYQHIHTFTVHPSIKLSFCSSILSLIYPTIHQGTSFYISKSFHNRYTDMHSLKYCVQLALFVSIIESIYSDIKNSSYLSVILIMKNIYTSVCYYKYACNTYLCVSVIILYL